MNTRLNEQTKKMLRYIGFLIGKYGKDNPELDVHLRGLYRQVKDLEIEIDIALEEVTQMYLRNAAYPGDMVGWLDDDFTYDEPDDEADEDTEK